MKDDTVDIISFSVVFQEGESIPDICMTSNLSDYATNYSIKC